MRLFLPLLLLSSTLFAYTVNDTLSEPIQKKLQLDPQKITIVDFFASWCDSCKKEIPHISAINKTLDTSKYAILGIDVDKKYIPMLVKVSDQFLKSENEELVMESVTRLEVKDDGVEVSTFFEDPKFVPGVQVQVIDFLGGKVFLGKTQDSQCLAS